MAENRIHGIDSLLEDDHALNMEDMGDPDETSWTVWRDGVLLGLGTLRELPDGNGEITSMRTPMEHRGQGVATFVLRKLLDEARERGYRRVSLQTGDTEAFAAARRLYARHGFVECGPFADWEGGRGSVFMTLDLTALGSTGS